MIVIILIYYFFSMIFFKEILYGENIIFPYALNKFYIDIEYPKLWKKIKLYFFIINILTPVTILLIYNFKKYNIWKKLYIKGLDKNKERDFFKINLDKHIKKDKFSKIMIQDKDSIEIVSLVGGG